MRKTAITAYQPFPLVDLATKEGRRKEAKRTHHLRRFVLPLIDEELEARVDRRCEFGRTGETVFDERLGGVAEGNEVGNHLVVLGGVLDEGEAGRLRRAGERGVSKREGKEGKGGRTLRCSRNERRRTSTLPMRARREKREVREGSAEDLQKLVVSAR